MTKSVYPNSNDITIVAVDEQLPLAVVAIGKIHFEGNVIPHEWYQKITLQDGKPDLPAITILAEIVYWYRPVRLLDSQGRPVIRKKFDEDMFQSGASYYESKFGLTKNQVRKALKRLEEAGFIRREYREVMKRGIKLNNVMFIEPVASKILEITHPPQYQVVVLASENTLAMPPGRGDGVSPTGERVSPTGERVSPTGERVSPTGERVSPTGERVSPTGETNTKTSTETSTETSTDFTKTTTTTTPEQRLTETGSGSSSSKLIFDFHLAALTSAQQQRVATILRGLDADTAQQVVDEFNTAIESGCIKKRWAWLQSVARSARDGSFVPTADLADRRRALAQAKIAKAPERTLSEIWKAHQQGLLNVGITTIDYHTYIAPLRGTEDGRTLWLEAPNPFVCEWVNSHLPIIKGVLRPHTALSIRVCIG